jgi:hypothetical protein
VFLRLPFSSSVIPTGVAGLFFRAVPGAPATERRDHGSQRSSTQLDETIEEIFAQYLFAVICSPFLHTLPQSTNCIPHPNLI